MEDRPGFELGRVGASAAAMQTLVGMAGLSSLLFVSPAWFTGVAVTSLASLFSGLAYGVFDFLESDVAWFFVWPSGLLLAAFNWANAWRMRIFQGWTVRSFNSFLDKVNGALVIIASSMGLYILGHAVWNRHKDSKSKRALTRIARAADVKGRQNEAIVDVMSFLDQIGVGAMKMGEVVLALGAMVTIVKGLTGVLHAAKHVALVRKATDFMGKSFDTIAGWLYTIDPPAPLEMRFVRAERPMGPGDVVEEVRREAEEEAEAAHEEEQSFFEWVRSQKYMRWVFFIALCLAIYRLYHLGVQRGCWREFLSRKKRVVRQCIIEDDGTETERDVEVDDEAVVPTKVRRVRRQSWHPEGERDVEIFEPLAFEEEQEEQEAVVQREKPRSSRLVATKNVQVGLYSTGDPDDVVLTIKALEARVAALKEQQAKKKRAVSHEALAMELEDRFKRWSRLYDEHWYEVFFVGSNVGRFVLGKVLKRMDPQDVYDFIDKGEDWNPYEDPDEQELADADDIAMDRRYGTGSGGLRDVEAKAEPAPEVCNVPVAEQQLQQADVHQQASEQQQQQAQAAPSVAVPVIEATEVRPVRPPAKRPILVTRVREDPPKPSAPVAVKRWEPVEQKKVTFAAVQEQQAVEASMAIFKSKKKVKKNAAAAKKMRAMAEAQLKHLCEGLTPVTVPEFGNDEVKLHSETLQPEALATMYTGSANALVSKIGSLWAKTAGGDHYIGHASPVDGKWVFPAHYVASLVSFKAARVAIRSPVQGEHVFDLADIKTHPDKDIDAACLPMGFSGISSVPHATPKVGDVGILSKCWDGNGQMGLKPLLVRVTAVTDATVQYHFLSRSNQTVVGDCGCPLMSPDGAVWAVHQGKILATGEGVGFALTSRVLGGLNRQ